MFICCAEHVHHAYRRKAYNIKAHPLYISDDNEAFVLLKSVEIVAFKSLHIPTSYVVHCPSSMLVDSRKSQTKYRLKAQSAKSQSQCVCSQSPSQSIGASGVFPS